MARKRIGELLLERGAIGLKQLEEALAAQRVTRERLGAVLVRQGALSEDQLAQVLADALGLPACDLVRRVPTKDALEKVRVRFCEAHDLLPLAVETRQGRRTLVVAMADPLNVPATEELAFTTGLQVAVEVAPISGIRDGILRHYHGRKPEAAEDPTQSFRIDGLGAPLLADDAVIEDEEGEIIEGEELPKDDLPGKRAKKLEKRGLSKDLDYLFGKVDESEVEVLERKFWALLRLMVRKGLITKEEFNAEFDDEK